MNKTNRNRRKRTITRTFRIKQELDDVLQEEAARQGISVNVLLNKLLRKYSLYSRWTERNNNVNLSKQTLREILHSIQIEKIEEAGTKSGSLDAINIVNAMGLAQEYDSFIYLITEHFGGPDFARWFHCFYHKQGNKDIFHLQHDLGRGWSVYLEKYIISFLHALADVEVNTRIYDYAVTLEVERPRDIKRNQYD